MKKLVYFTEEEHDSMVALVKSVLSDVKLYHDCYIKFRSEERLEELRALLEGETNYDSEE